MLWSMQHFLFASERHLQKMAKSIRCNVLSFLVFSCAIASRKTTPLCARQHTRRYGALGNETERHDEVSHVE